jgi:hypothetical protein
MDEPVWEPLPTLWPQPAVCTEVGKLLLLVFTQDGVPTWEVRIDLRKDPARKDDLLAEGTADCFAAAKTAALFEAKTATEAMSGEPVERAERA